ncbi:hypothetical protein N7474_010859 [Penicillium riverlandense]|uniref:uncharacterized protein n=1 Tax=Penicillium riverlandense TaxID=1903569 RepID=UPI0025494FD7|nr:uncharacterized protein N7474_010859 [Penicillium riverlandense]KAJ5804972.1 hypothetical protein N7474_010859 [Penicillium riverlandense]
MTSDSTLLHHPTESLILSAKRRFFPFRIPNFHTQLRHYISTADPDRIYVIVERIIYAIHISAQKRESIAAIPFEPRALAAAYGWIGVGGPENGECAFIRIGDQGMQAHGSLSQHSDVDSALPLDLDPLTRSVSPDTARGDSPRARRLIQNRFPEVELHKFGGSIVNSVTIHRFPGDKDSLADEDVMVLSNNDCTVTVYSLTRATVLKVLDHPKYMNYATISPDSKLLTAVGDEDRAYFYKISRDWESTVITDSGKRLTGWEFDLTWCVEMDIGPRPDDATCFTVAFSPSSHLCAVGSQSGIVTVIDTETIHKKAGEADSSNPVICQFPASRSCSEGGAVRCMTFSPEPWDLLVWLEGHGRAGVADVRQAFLRRQILQLDADGPDLQEVHMEPFSDDSESQRMEDEGMGATSRTRLDEELNETGEGVDRTSLRDTLIQDLTERERLIMDFLNNARFTSRLEEGLTERPERPARVALQPHPAVRMRVHGSTDGTMRASRPTSPPNLYDSPRNISRDGDLGPSPRRQSSVVLSQGSRSSETGTTTHDRQPSITLSWTTPPSELQSTESDSTSRNVDPDIDVGHESSRPMRPPEVTGPTPATLDFGLSSEGMTRLRSQRSSSTPRRTERAPSGSERRYDPSRLSNYEIRANVAAERLRRQRQIANEVHNRSFEREHRHRQQFLGFEQAHSPRWIRNIINDLPDRSLIHGPGAEEPDSTAGVGWGADGRTLYIATLEGIFEFQINVHDRKTFPVLSCR